MFVEKKIYKANTLANVSLGYVDHVEKIPHLPHMEKRMRHMVKNQYFQI